MNKPERVLKVLEDNGFDRFNSSKIALTARCAFLYSVLEDEFYSLADLATNKSALEAGAKVNNVDDANLKMWCISTQRHLIYDITYNNAEDYWSIWFSFLGLVE